MSPSDRISRPGFYMQIAELVASRGTCPRAQVGALIVKDGRIVSHGYNGAAPGEEHCTDVGCQAGDGQWLPKDMAGDILARDGCQRAVHAEANAIAFAAKAGVPTDGAALYSTHAPCPVCARLVAACGIISVMYRNPYRDEEGIRLLKRLGRSVRQLG